MALGLELIKGGKQRRLPGQPLGECAQVGTCGLRVVFYTVMWPIEANRPLKQLGFRQILRPVQRLHCGRQTRLRRQFGLVKVAPKLGHPHE